VNLVGPDPVTNAQFTDALGRTLGRPTPLPVPAVALKAVLGEAANELVLTGPRAVPAVLQRTGYQFQHPTVTEALAAAT
jgi:NAD dependent epimerase/dehydratase family enzyme